MPKGKATGVDRAYQVTCRDVLVHRDPSLVPLEADGIDIAVPLPDATWTFDVALRALDGRVVVAECRRTRNSVKQKDVAAFALTVESLRRTLGSQVSAFFFTKSMHQLGAVRVGDYYGIEVAILQEDAHPPGFNMTFLSYDPDREQKLRHLVMHVETGQLSLTGHPPSVVQTDHKA